MKKTLFLLLLIFIMSLFSTNPLQAVQDMQGSIEKVEQTKIQKLLSLLVETDPEKPSEPKPMVLPFAYMMFAYSGLFFLFMLLGFIRSFSANNNQFGDLTVIAFLEFALAINIAWILLLVGLLI